MHIKDFVTQQRAGHLYYLEGEDIFYRDLAEKYFTSLIPDDLRDFNLKKIEDLRSADVLKSAAEQSPLMWDFTVVLVCDRDATLKGQEAALAEVIAATPEDCIIVFSCVRFLNKKLAEKLERISVERLQGFELTEEVKKFFPGGIENVAVSRLQEYCNRDMLRMKNEAIKLSAVTGGKMIRVADVEDLVVSDAETQVFEFQNCLQRKEKAKAFDVMHRLTERGAEPQYLMSALISQYRRLLYAAISPMSDAELAKALNVKEFAVKKSREAARLYKPIKLKEIFDTLTNFEYSVRKGELGADIALTRAVQYLMEG